MDQNVKALENLQEAFRGSLDPEVVDLIFTQSNYVVDDAIEKLLSISVSSDNLNPDSENKSTTQNGSTSIEDSNFRPCDRNTSRRKKKLQESSSFRDDKSNSLALLPKDQGHSVIDTGSSNNITKIEIPLDSSEQLSNSTKESVKPKEPSSSTNNHHSNDLTLASHSAQSGIEVTDRPLSSNELPPWPDYNQGYRMPPQIQSLPGQPYNPYQGFPIPHDFQGQRFTGDTGYYHYNPQYQTQQNIGTYHPRSAIQAPGIRYQPAGMHQTVQGAPQNRAYIKRKEFQPYNGMRKPREFYQREEKDAFTSNQTRSEETFLPRGKVLVILRGLPGSGKTTLAQKLLKRDGLILSTDEFFMRNGIYQFEPNDIPEAHEWNQKRAKDCMQIGVSPIIIDNTNMQAWEMRPYASMGQRFGYQVMIKEPDTPWKWNTKELFKRNQHQVTLFSIQNMKEKYQKDLTVESILTPSLKIHLNGVNPKGEICCSNKDETHEHNSECFKPMSVAPKQTSRYKQTSQDDSFTQDSLSSASENDETNSGITMQSQSENKRKNQVKSSVASHKPSSISQLRNQSSKQSKNKFEDARQEMETLRSHGSRSPVQDMDFSLSELSQDDESLEINKSFIKNSSFTTEAIQPKPQRTPKRRERTSKLLEKMQDSEEVKENPYKVLDSKELKINSCENKRSHAISESERSVEEEENNEEDDDEQKFITGIFNSENTASGKFASPGEMNEEKTARLSNHNEIHSKDGLLEQDIFSLGKQIVAGENKSGISHEEDIESTGFSRTRNTLTTNESKTFETNRKTFGLESYLTKDIESKIENDEETSVKAEDYLLAETNDCDEPFENAKIAPGFLNSAEKAETVKDSSLGNFKNDLSESDLSGFQFLNTCFPDIDIQILVNVLAQNQGDVTKAVESILCHEDNSPKEEVKSPKQNDSSEVESPKRNTPDIDSSENISSQTSSFERKPGYTTPDQDLKPLQDGQSKEFQAAKSLPSLQSMNLDDHVRHDHGRFQMPLDPAVAIHLMELFGPIESVSLEGDFSSKDLIVEVDSGFAKLLYNQWRKTIQNNTKAKSSHTEKQPKVSRTQNKEESRKRLKDNHGKQSRAIIEQRRAADLRQIMDEQKAVEQSRKEQVQSDESMAVVLKRKKLYAMFPGVDPSALDELFEVNRYELEPTVSMVETSCNLQAKQSEYLEKQAKQSEFQEKQANSTCTSYDDSPRDPVETEFQALQDPDYKDFRAEANTHYKLRDECFRKAAFAFSKKQGQLAQFYASQGHKHTERIRQANRRAAARILENKNSNWDENSIDLHGLHVDEALLALEERLQFADSTKNYGPRYLSVITGRGNHSKQGKAKIKPAVLEYLQRNNYSIEELQPGLVRVAINR